MAQSNLRSQTLIRVAIVAGILILLNFVSVRLFGRLDLTRNNLFTLSDASKNLVKSLDDRLTIKAYFTEELPAPYNNIRRTVLDQLNEYKAYSGGNLQFDFINPTGEKGEQEAQQQGIQPVQVQAIKDDKLELVRGYLGLVFMYEDRREVIPVVQNTSTLEYDISSTIKRLTQKSRKKVAFLAGQGESGTDQMRRAHDMLSRQYDVQTIDFSAGQPIGHDIAVLLIVSPTQPFSETAKYKIDQYIMRGGKVAFLLNKVDADLRQQFGRELDLKLEDLLEHYGLRINPDLVRDAQCAPINIVQQQGTFSIQSQVPFPYIPVASTFSPENMAVQNLQSVVLFFVSSVDTTALAPKGLRGEILMRSSKRSGRQSQVFYFNPMQEYQPEMFTEQQIPLAATVAGTFNSFYAGKPVPVDTGANALPPVGNATIATAQMETRIVLVGDGDFMKDQYLGGRDNITFFANLVDYLADDAGLITIRSKDVSLPPLEQVSDGIKKVVKFGTMLVPPLMVIGFGLIRWKIRKAKRKALEAAA